eukprot:TRINITY_DN293_c0_g1_i2.p1 TRINITY_DN293_c0_g1~~TRINITY_DN293_c0_g1_i2.p1  ORF type:complete len:354 (+),score=48.87 TRINITY_DN293_c0_g1_i2:48-1109(+)
MACIIHIAVSATLCMFPRRQVRGLLACGVAMMWRSADAVQMSLQHGVPTVQSSSTDFDGASYVSLWDGGEVSVALAKNTTHVNSKQSREGLDNVAQALGLYNTGTNLLTSFLQVNLPSGFFVVSDMVRPGLWKHSNLKYSWERGDARKKIKKVKSRYNYSAIAMIRNPFSWMASMLKAPYDLRLCLGNEYDGPFKVRSDWLKSECYVPCPTTAGGEVVPRSRGVETHCKAWHPKTLSSIVEVWNEWNRAYMSATEYGFDRIMVVRYEDLVTHPTQVLSRIAKYLKVEMPSEPQIPEEAAKKHGEPVGRVAALVKMRNQEFMGTFGPEDVAWVCSRLDKSLLERYGYASSCAGF